MLSFFRRRKEADATARRIIDQGRFLGARTPREAVEMLWARPLTQNEWDRSASVWERIWQESLKGSCPGAWCNSDEPIVITGGAGSIKLPSRLAA